MDDCNLLTWPLSLAANKEEQGWNWSESSVSTSSGLQRALVTVARGYYNKNSHSSSHLWCACTVYLYMWLWTRLIKQLQHEFSHWRNNSSSCLLIYAYCNQELFCGDQDIVFQWQSISVCSTSSIESKYQQCTLPDLILILSFLSVVFFFCTMAAHASSTIGVMSTAVCAVSNLLYIGYFRRENLLLLYSIAMYVTTTTMLYYYCILDPSGVGIMVIWVSYHCCTKAALHIFYPKNTGYMVVSYTNTSIVM